MLPIIKADLYPYIPKAYNFKALLKGMRFQGLCCLFFKT